MNHLQIRIKRLVREIMVKNEKPRNLHQFDGLQQNICMQICLNGAFSYYDTLRVIWRNIIKFEGASINNQNGYHGNERCLFWHQWSDNNNDSTVDIRNSTRVILVSIYSVNFFFVLILYIFNTVTTELLLQHLNLKIERENLLFNSWKS